jgi:hypothetical protein
MDGFFFCVRNGNFEIACLLFSCSRERKVQNDPSIQRLNSLSYFVVAAAAAASRVSTH